MRVIVPGSGFAALLLASVALAAELQVPLDQAGRVQRIDAALAKRLRMFTDRPEFHEARLFQLADSSYVLEIFELTGPSLTRLTRDRVPLSSFGVDSLRSLVTTALAERRTTPTLDTSGRPLFVATTTAMSFGFYGWAVPYLFLDENASSETATGTYLLTASAGTFIPLFVTRGRSVSQGTALMTWYGMSRGTVHGALLPNALVENPADKTPVASAFALSIVEGFAGFHWASHTRMSEGTANVIASGGDFGALYGAGIAYLFDPDGRVVSAGALIGAGAGIAGGAFYASRRQHTYGDASVMRSAGWVGGYVGLAAVQIADRHSTEEPMIGGSLAGASLGLVMGDALVRRTDFSFGQGVIVDLCASGGWLFGLGIAFVASGSSGLEEPVFYGSTALGAVAGYAIGYAASAAPARRAAADRTSWRFDIAPLPPARAGQAPGVMVTLATTLR